MVPVAQKFYRMGFEILATRGTHAALTAAGVAAQLVNKVSEARPHVVDRMKNGEIDLVVNTSEGKDPHKDGYNIRRAAIERGTPYITTVAAAKATADAVEAFIREEKLTVTALQDYYA